MKKKILEISLWGLLMAALFSIGWLRGKNPDWSWRSLFPAHDRLVILTPDPSWLPESLIRPLSKELDIEIQTEVVPEFADFEARIVPLDAPALLWIPASWAKALGRQGLLAELRGQSKSLENKVSPDFLLKEGDHLFFVPVLWTAEGQELRVEGWALPHADVDRRRAWKIISTLLENEWAERHVLETPAASALGSLDQGNLPFEKRSQALRNLNFLKLNTGNLTDK